MIGFLVGVLVFVCVWCIGGTLGIHPTLAEGFLVVIACLLSDLARELIP